MMNLRNLDNYEKFKKYILQQLGAPVININVDDEQILNRITDAVQLFSQWHFDGTTEDVVVIELEKNKRTYNLSENSSGKIILSVVAELNSSTLTDWFLNNSLHMRENPIILYQNWNDFDRFFQTAQFIGMIKDVLSASNTYSFNYTTQELTLLNNPMSDFDGHSSAKRGFVVYLIDAFNKNEAGDLMVNNCIFNNEWLKKYATAQVKYQWGQNLIKYGNVTLPGGLSLNGDAIRAEAKEEIQQLEERLRTEFTMRPGLRFE